MIDKATAIPALLRRLDNLPEGHAIDLRTYKRNRSVVIARVGPDDFELLETGFHEERFRCAGGELRRLLKLLLKREFPRSTKIRVYDLGPAGADAPVKRKTL
ncbi:hypothetical protein [Pseudodesulfovibrio sp.]|uniref:hypothetical protein n=1 Tax=Pseudodesulfovibrio sp. TaxID=2035812 RepID=UPI00262C4BD0|nr:hypothetical protein [Pseudodesulfovibrio sp.]MDD3312599.1 hypothetical protein [Pseudodesulfovibrio sp.]